MLEARAMLAADDIAVSLAGGRVVLLLDPLGAEISSLPTSYNAASRVLSIRAATAGMAVRRARRARVRLRSAATAATPG